MNIFTLTKDQKETIYLKTQSILRLNDQMKFWQVDFTKPWWNNFFYRKWSYFFILIGESSQAIFTSLTPLILGYGINQRNSSVFLMFVIGYILLELVNRLAVNRYQIAQADIQGSILNSSYSFFLTVDPIFHSTKSSGAIQSKIQAAGREFNFMVGLFIFDITEMFIGYLAVLVALFTFSSKIAFVSLGFFLLISSISFFAYSFIAKIYTGSWIKRREKWSAITVENLTQNALIRSTFGTVEQLTRTETLSTEALESRTISIWIQGVFTTLVRMAYISSIAVIGTMILSLVQENTVSTITGVAMLLTYMGGSQQILKIGGKVTQFIESVEQMNDLWDFIRNFGSQSYPVLPNQIIKK
jgi:hypothetical protein